MLDVKALTDLLSQNRDERLCKAWYLMTSNGTLLATSKPIRLDDLRRQAAMATMSWQEYDRSGSLDQFPRGFEEELRQGHDQSPLHTLIIESETATIIIRKLQQQLLLVLKGGVPPGRGRVIKRITAENQDGSIRPSAKGEIRDSELSGDSHNIAQDVLQMQRRKVDALSTVITTDFARNGFSMPDEVGMTIF